jgi:PAS domain S-box-containing protein
MRMGNFEMRSLVLRYGLALILVPISILLRYAMAPLLGAGEEYVTVFPAIVLAAILAGRGPAILTGVLGSLAAAYFFLPALNFPALSGIVMVILTGILAGWLAQRLRDALATTQAQAKALAESEQRFAAFMRHLPGAAWMKDLQGRYVYANAEAERIFSKSLQEIQGRTDEQIFPPETAKQFRKNDLAALADGSIETIEVLQQADGLDHYSIVSKFPVPGANGPPAYVGGVAFDITDRKRAEEIVRESEEHLRLTTEAANIGAWTWDIVNNKNVWTDKCKDIFGVSRQTEPSIELLMTVIHPEDRQTVKRILDEAIEQHKEYNAEYRIIHPDNSIHWIHSRGRAYYDADTKKPVRAYGVITDVTGRKQIEEALRREQAFLRNVIDAAPSMVFVKDWDGRFVLVNKALAACYGTTVDGIVGKTDADFNANAEEVAHFLRDDREVMTTRQPKFIPIEPVTCSDGNTRWFTTIKVPLLDEDATCNKILGVATNITDRKQAEDALRESESHLRSQTEELETIIGIVSHDLRAPLLNIRGFSKLLRTNCDKIRNLFASADLGTDIRTQFESTVKESMLEAVGFIDTSTGVMNNLVETLVEVARAGLVVPQPETLDMNQLVKDVVDSIKIKFTDTGANIDVEDLPPCYADRMHVAQIFTNLIDNALKYLDPNRKGEICVSGRTQNGRAVYQIADNGIGIAPENQEKVFEIYYRLSEKAAVGGEGVGLSVVKQMIGRNNGRIWLVSDKGKGSNFFVALPLSRPL